MNNPRLIMGLPVYNGDNYLKQTLDSILNQTYHDFRLIISDNASTDNTAAICQEYAQKDSRIIYYRQEKNLGAAPNYNFVFQPGNAPYYKWVAHDDLLKPDYLRQCIEMLDNDPSLAIVHCPIEQIDAYNNSQGVMREACDFRLDGETPQARLRKALWTYRNWDVFGVIRSEYMAKTHLHGDYLDADRIFLAEVILQGNMGYLEEPLFCLRVHQESYTQRMSQTDNLSKQDWFKTDGKENIFQKLIRVSSKALNSRQIENNFIKLTTVLIKLKEYISAIIRLPLSFSEKLACIYILIEWMVMRGVEGLTKKDSYRQAIVEQYSSLA
jgi:glycosyltransferase involved in cell wall biosynthesis